MNNNLTIDEALRKALSHLASLTATNNKERALTYKIINVILTAYRHTPTSHRQELNVITKAIQSTPRNTTEENKVDNLLVNFGRLKNYLMKEHQPETTLKGIICTLKDAKGNGLYSPPTTDKPTPSNFNQNFKQLKIYTLLAGQPNSDNVKLCQF
jgi:hypothetical protein